MKLIAGSYEELVENCKFIPFSCLDAKFSIRVPSEQCRGFRLYEIVEVSKNPNEDISLERVEYDKVHPWVDIPTEDLNTLQGKHTYRISFYEEDGDEFASFFFTYVIQTDYPEKPYVYMRNRETSFQGSEGSYV